MSEELRKIWNDLDDKQRKLLLAAARKLKEEESQGKKVSAKSLA